MKHLYISTACQHDLHGECRRTCKFCEANCLCACHEKGSGDRVEPLPRPPRRQARMQVIDPDPELS